MAQQNTLLGIAAVIGVAAAIYALFPQWFKKTTPGDCSQMGIMQPICELGKQTSRTTATAQAEIADKAAIIRSLLEQIGSGKPYYLDALHIPVTPEGFYSTSNRTWVLSNGVKLGLPAGMTPKDFCNANPAAPICLPGAGVI
jgi:hypothetical protein